MIKTIKEKTAGAGARAAVPKEWWSGDIRASQPEEELPSQTRCRTSGPAYGRHVTPLAPCRLSLLPTSAGRSASLPGSLRVDRQLDRK